MMNNPNRLQTPVLSGLCSYQLPNNTEWLDHIVRILPAFNLVFSSYCFTTGIESLCETIFHGR